MNQWVSVKYYEPLIGSFKKLEGIGFDSCLYVHDIGEVHVLG
jgi:hypothetical protein